MDGKWFSDGKSLGRMAWIAVYVAAAWGVVAWTSRGDDWNETRWRCPCTPDGACIPNRPKFGYYPARWRRWPGQPVEVETPTAPPASRPVTPVQPPDANLPPSMLEQPGRTQPGAESEVDLPPELKRDLIQPNRQPDQRDIINPAVPKDDILNPTLPTEDVPDSAAPNDTITLPEAESDSPTQPKSDAKPPAELDLSPTKPGDPFKDDTLPDGANQTPPNNEGALRSLPVDQPSANQSSSDPRPLDASLRPQTDFLLSPFNTLRNRSLDWGRPARFVQIERDEPTPVETANNDIQTSPRRPSLDSSASPGNPLRGGDPLARALAAPRRTVPKVVSPPPAAEDTSRSNPLRAQR